MSQTVMLLDETHLKACGRVRIPTGGQGRKRALIVALHGGGFTSLYFDLPGHSLLDEAASQGCGIIALDRSGYGSSSPPERGAQTIPANVKWVDRVIEKLWPRFLSDYSGVVLIGHSIGAAVAIEVAASRVRWPLLGVAVSGVGLRTKRTLGAFWDQFPPDSWFNLDVASRNQFMFGPAEFVPSDVKPLVQSAYAPLATREVLEICTLWPQRAEEICGNVTVPLHYRQGEYDSFWEVDEAEVEAFARCFRRADSTDAQMVRNAGHCIDFHYTGSQLRAEQAAFATRCVGHFSANAANN